MSSKTKTITIRDKSGKAITRTREVKNPRRNKRERRGKRGAKKQSDFKFNSQPAAKGYDLKQRQGPKITRSGNTVTVTHREYIAAINGTDNSVENMVLEKLRINPGDTETFEWLSTFSLAYEKFELQKMQVEYVPVTTTITTGQIIMVPDYNVDNPEQFSVSQVLNNMDAVSGSVWTKKNLNVNPKKFNQTKSYLIRNDNMALQNFLLYDPVNIYVGSQGTPANQALGQIFISYTIKFMIPSTNNYFPVLGGSIVGTATWRPDGRPSFLSFVPNPNPNARFGNYLPNLIDDASIQFTRQFVGIMTFRISTQNGFDAGRVLSFEAREGATVWNGSPVLNDSIVQGLDEWMIPVQINSPAGGIVRVVNPLIVPGQGGGPIQGIRFYFASLPLKWWQHPSPYVQAWNITGPVGGMGRVIGDRIRSTKTKQKVTLKELLTGMLMEEEETHHIETDCSNCSVEEFDD